MIFFRGWGLVVVAVAFVLGIAISAFCSGAMPPTKENLQNTSVLAALASAVFCWWAGRALNDPAKDKIVVDTKTGEQIRIESRHTLMFIPIQWYAIPLFLFFVSVPNLGQQG